MFEKIDRADTKLALSTESSADFESCSEHLYERLGSVLYDPMATTIEGNITSVLVFWPDGKEFNIIVEATVWRDDGNTADTYQATYTQATKAPDPKEIEIQLYPDVSNHIYLAGDDQQPIASLQIFSDAAWNIIPPGYLLLTTDTVTDEMLDEWLKEMIGLVKKVSEDLGKMVEDNISFGDGKDTLAGKVDKSKDYSKSNTRIKVSKKQWKEGLAELLKAPADKKAAIKEELIRRFLVQLLHEASHRKAMIEGDSLRTLWKEEERNTKALITRLLDLLKKIRTRITTAAGAPKPALGDGKGLEAEDDLTKWFKRIKTMLQNQTAYRFLRVAKKHPSSKDQYKRFIDKWKDLKQALKLISADDGKSKEQKLEAARDKYRQFKTNTQADRTALEEKYDVKIDVNLDEKTLKPELQASGTDKWKSAALPSLPD